MASTNETVNKIVKILDGKKGRDIEVLNISELTTMTDYFIIVTGGSDTQVKALCDNVEEELEKEHLLIKKDIRRHSGFFWRMMKL